MLGNDIFTWVEFNIRLFARQGMVRQHSPLVIQQDYRQPKPRSVWQLYAMSSNLPHTNKLN